MAKTVSRILGLSKVETRTLVIASLLHDIGMPPFSHTTEKVLKTFFGFNHEEQTVKIINGDIGQDGLFLGRVPESPTILRRLKEKEKCDPHEVILAIRGQGPVGTILNSALDIDNIDGITRTYLHSQGRLAFSKPSPLDLLNLFRRDPDDRLSLDRTNPLLRKWERRRRGLYRKLLDNPLDCAADAMLGHAIEKAILSGYLDENCWKKTDVELINDLVDDEKMTKYMKNEKDIQEIKTLVSRLRTGNLYVPIFQLEANERTAKKLWEVNDKYEIKEEMERKFQRILQEKLKLKCDMILSLPVFWETKTTSFKEEGEGLKTRLDIFSSVPLKLEERTKIKQEFKQTIQDMFGEQPSFFDITEAFTEYRPDPLFREV